MRLDKEIISYFKKWQRETNSYPHVEIEKVEFSFKKLDEIAFFPAMTRVTGRVDKSIEEFNQMDDSEKKLYYPLISGTVENNQISGYVHKQRIGKKSLSQANVISWSRINGKHFFIQSKPVCTNDDSFVMDIKDGCNINYIHAAITASMMSSNYEWGNKAGKEIIKQVSIPLISDTDIQLSVVEFIQYYKNKFQEYRDALNKLKVRIDTFDHEFLPRIFNGDKDVFIADRFNLWAQRKGYTFKWGEIVFSAGRILDKTHPNNTVCEKRMGFTPDDDPYGDINWFTVADLNAVNEMYITDPNTKDKTSMSLIHKKIDASNTGKSEKLKPIKKGDILVSFKLSVGIVKIYDSALDAYCNEAIDILTAKSQYLNSYLAYNCMVEYPRKGTMTNNGLTLNDESKALIDIYIPKINNGPESLELQKIIVEFINEWKSWKRKFDYKSNTIAKLVSNAEKTLIAKVFKGIGDEVY